MKYRKAELLSEIEYAIPETELNIEITTTKDEEYGAMISTHCYIHRILKSGVKQVIGHFAVHNHDINSATISFTAQCEKPYSNQE